MLHGRRHLQLVDSERDAMRIACQFNAQLMDFVRPHVKAGITTEALDRMVHEYTLDHGHTPACLNYQGYPKSCCTSINEVICHGIPDDYELKDGDIVNVDLTSIVDGWHGDQSETFLIGEVTPEAKQVTQTAFDCLYLAIGAIYPECRVSEIGRVIVEEAKKYNFGVVEEFVGHGLGRRFHQDPSIPHVPTRAAHSVRLMPGVCFTIEPMINIGVAATQLDPTDGWTVRTRDRSLSAQFEHTILMTENGPEILTLTKDGPQKGHQF
ncbi:type I methionyl aminopeptidase [Bremerella sp. T1]|uniref:type I methionyl aminopeptidase n=1 Tax=Bremerella sp. TYQ1 TaxID=3119568 RepID=UPI001CCD008C|nr:type I methionyl aminopeptidase [Bremerella volcania]UBM36861.1 type I methionyl aminopeptidase [Bremerella volcania]